jgi:methylaspartate ammonia-lyase
MGVLALERVPMTRKTTTSGKELVMRIKKALVSRGMGGYYFDDYTAIKGGAQQDGFIYPGQPMTAGHRKIRQAGETMSIMLILEDDTVAFGDAVAIQYMGVVGRDPILLSDRYIPVVQKDVLPRLEGRQLTTFRQMSEEFDSLEINGHRLHTGIRYGLSQAFLDALAKSQRKTMAEIVAQEFGTKISTKPIPVLAQSGDDRYVGADKMILKKVDAIPQGLFNNVSKVGQAGEVLLDYVRWLRGRVEKYGEPGYRPTFHLDVYGIVGNVFGNDADRIADYLIQLEKLAKPFSVCIEDPIVAENRESQIELTAALRRALEHRGSAVEISIDEWCNNVADTEAFVDARAAHMIQIKAPSLGGFQNSVEAVLYCKRHGVKAFLGGTCNGTDQSTRVTVHVALATQADLIYNKPGMGVDEGYMIVFNEMQRTLTLLQDRTGVGT